MDENTQAKFDEKLTALLAIAKKKKNVLEYQEITDYFNSNAVIVFYTPMGMEIGFNYDDGYAWVTATYEDYEDYLKVF